MLKRKRSIIIASILVVIMLLSMVLPLFNSLATDVEKISVNGELYSALKKELIDQEVNAEYVDESRTIIIEQNEIAKITKLNLSNNNISDLNGLEIFKNVKELDLSSNNLNKDTDLSILNEFTLSKLDLSSNAIEDLSSIENLENIDEVNLHNQIFNSVNIIEVDKSDKEICELPNIFSLLDFIEPEYFIEDKSKAGNISINWSGFNHRDIVLNIGTKNGDEISAYEGMLKLTLNITDSENELYNTRVNIFYVVVSKDEEGIYVEDKNLYKAIKEQLTEGQSVNNELISYESRDDEVRRNLYNYAYDEPQVFVINNDDLVSQITNLDLEGNKIESLNGIEKFVGLSKSLNASSNYIESIGNLKELQTNQEEAEEKIREKIANINEEYSESLNKFLELKESLKTKKENKTTMEEELDKIQAELSTLTEENKITAKVDEYNKKSEEYGELLTEIEEIESQYNAKKSGLSSYASKLFSTYTKINRLAYLGSVSLKELSPDSISAMNIDTVKSIYESSVSKIVSMEDFLLEEEKDLIMDTFSIPTTYEVEEKEEVDDGNGGKTIQTNIVVKDIENPIKTYFEKLDKTDWTIGTYRGEVVTLKEIAEYSQSLTYCLMEKAFGGCTSCVAEEYFDAEREELGFLDEQTTYIDAAETLLEDNGCIEYTLDNVSTVAVRIYKATEEEIGEYVVISKLRELDLSNNLIEDIQGIEELIELKGIDLYDNEIVDISEINWSSLKYLEDLDLGFNCISNITSLETAVTLKYLNLSKNLIAGSFDFNILQLENLQDLNLSSNQICDLSSLITSLKYEAKAKSCDSVGEFLDRDDTIDVNFSSQNLSIFVEDKVELNSNKKVDLPAVFAQFEELSSAETSFGINSIYGNVTNNGKKVILNTQNEGSFTGTVSVIGGLGSGSTCTISYSVGEIEPMQISLSSRETSIKTGASTYVSIKITGDNVVSEKVNWSIAGNASENTTIDSAGKLSIGSDETSNNIVVKAVSAYDETVYGELTFTIEKVVEPGNSPEEDNQEEQTNEETEENEEFEPSEELGFLCEDNIVRNVSTKMDVSDFKAEFLEGVNDVKAVVKDEDKNIVTSGYVKTGMIVYLYSKNDSQMTTPLKVDGNYLVYFISVKGDINGDGIADGMDSKLIKAYRSEVISLDDVKVEAADINNDGKVDKIDSQLLIYHRAEISGCSFDYVK